MIIDKDSLRKELDQIPVIDSHEHLHGHEQCQPKENVTDFIIDPYIVHILHFADKVLAEKIKDTTRPDQERWNDFLKIWPSFRCTGYGSLIIQFLENWKIDSDLRSESFNMIKEHLLIRSPNTSRKAYSDAKIKATLTHYLAHPNLGGISNVSAFLNGSLSFSDNFYPLLGILPFHEFHSFSDLDALSEICDISIGSLNDLEFAVSSIVSQTISKGVIGLKDHSAYSSGLDFGPSDRSAAKKEFKSLISGNVFDKGAKILSDHMFHYLISLSIDLKLPVAIHTGYVQLSTHPKTNIRNFESILSSYPDARFDAYHLNYPYFDDFIALMKQFPNLWANCCWTHIVDQAYVIRFLESALTSIPSNHILGFGGDFVDLPESVIAHLDIAKDNIASVLTNAIQNKWISYDSAIEIANMWLNKNSADLYDI